MVSSLEQSPSAINNACECGANYRLFSSSGYKRTLFRFRAFTTEEKTPKLTKFTKSKKGCCTQFNLIISQARCTGGLTLTMVSVPELWVSHETYYVFHISPKTWLTLKELNQALMRKLGLFKRSFYFTIYNIFSGLDPFAGSALIDGKFLCFRRLYAFRSTEFQNLTIKDIPSGSRPKQLRYIFDNFI